MQLVRSVFLLACLGIAACASREILETRNAQAPPGVNLSGNWRIVKDSSADQRRLADALRRASGNTDIIPIPSESGRPSRSARTSAQRGSLVQVFLQTGNNLKVTQTAHGIFISFDRSVVNEFRFGENREVSIGEIVAQRVSGWDGNRYIVETLDRKGMKLTEQLYLSDGDQILNRLIILRLSDKDEVTLRQIFTRVEEAY